MARGKPSPRPRRRHWTPPALGTKYVRTSDGVTFICRNCYRRDQQVSLVSESGERAYPNADALEREYQQIVIGG
jgi:hypothetical protein